MWKAVEIRAWMSDYIPHKTMGAIAYPNQNIDQFGYEIQRRQIHIDDLVQDCSNFSA